MRDELIETNQERRLGYMVPGEKAARTAHFVPGKVNRIATDVFAALTASKDSPLAAALQSGDMVHRNAQRAQEAHDGERPFLSEERDLPPLQAAAQTFAATQDQNKAMDAAAQSSLPADLKATQRRK